MESMTWNDPELGVQGEPARRRKYRELQSQWRHEVLRAEAGLMTGRTTPVGSLLKQEDIDAQPDLNFLTKEAAEHAAERIEGVRQAGGTLEPGRLRRNLLSSMPLAFNLFGALRRLPTFLDLVRALWAPEAKELLDVQCEWSPRPKSDYLNDNTAFDAAIWFRDDENNKVLLGIEVKYTDDFSKTMYDTDRYRAVSDLWFERDAVELLKQPATNQMWRNTLLAASIGAKGDVDRALVGMLTLADDKAATTAATIISQHLLPSHADRLRTATIEDAANRARAIPSLLPWADMFGPRYLTGPSTTGSPAPFGPAPKRTIPSLT